MHLRLLLLCLLLLPPLVGRGETAEGNIPPALSPWADWVLYPKDRRVCPLRFDSGERYCAWPSALALNLGQTGGSFVQHWELLAKGWIPLPGDDRHWPTAVEVDGDPALVTPHQGAPALKLPAGHYRVSGRFDWRRMPEALHISPLTGVLQLTLDGSRVAFPELDTEGRLWLRKREKLPAGGSGDRLELRVQRLIVDAVPLRTITRVELEVAGRAREIGLSAVLLPAFVPLRLDSPLPARFDAGGALRVQVRPGRWVLRIEGRHPGPVTEITAPAAVPPWPALEVWAFEARPALRLVELEGLEPVDPRQTRLPTEWRRFPTFRAHAGQTLRMHRIRRGDPRPPPDRLTLERDLWLDFEGTGYSIRDRISGAMTRHWRLEVGAEIELGRVVIDGDPRLVTRLPGADTVGVEVRRGRIDLTADSRYQGPVASLPPVAWVPGFQHARATLHLPPGWRLIAVSGVDNRPRSWLQRWTLMDLFLVLIGAIAIARLWGWHWGLLGLAMLALVWHEADAPRFVWLNILAATALLRVLPAPVEAGKEGRLHTAVRWYLNLGLLSLVLLSLPFLVAQVRTGLYPQLERPWQVLGQGSGASPPAMVARDSMGGMAEIDEEAVSGQIPRESKAEGKARRKSAYGYPSASRATLEIDPKAMVQTGPGLPDWRWQDVPLSWSGPVEKEQRARLLLLSPRAGLALNLARVLLVIALALRLAGRLPRLRAAGTAPAAAIAVLPLLALPLLLGAAGATLAADFPGPEMLKELQRRLVAPPDCLPQCADLPTLRLELQPDSLTGRMQVVARVPTAVPLPGSAETWLPTEVLLPGTEQPGTIRDKRGRLWVQVPRGRHELLFSGPLPRRERVSLPLTLRPHRVEIDQHGWLVEGVDEEGIPDAQMQLLRRQSVASDAAADEPGPVVLPPFLRVERTLILGLDWRVETRVSRLSPTGRPILAKVPLLPGESVVTDLVRVDAGRVLVSLAGEQREFTWTSTLKEVPRLELAASRDLALVEVFRADIGVIWHARWSGVPAVVRQDPAGLRVPEWRPWPGERIVLQLARPQGVAGQTLTVDRSRLEVSPGRRSTDVTLGLTLRSSQGGQHSIRLPADARLRNVIIDGKRQPLAQDGDRVTLPVTPGAQQVELRWRQPGGERTDLTTPAVDLGIPSVNHSIRVATGADRWILWVSGPRLGPAVLFWGVVLVIVLAAALLGRVRLTPLGTHDWFLLGIGLSQSEAAVAVVVVGWLLALGWRRRVDETLSPARFNLMQIGLVLLTLVALVALFSAVRQGLLGLPDMQIAGNGSDARQLIWYQDRVGPEPLTAAVWSVPILVYRLLMLGWALWLAFRLLHWLQWGWQSLSTPLLWRGLRLHLGRHRKPKQREKPAGDGDEGPWIE